jgi:hypothetical protein
MGKVICPHCGAENPSSGILTMCRKCAHPLPPPQPESVPPPELRYAPTDVPASTPGPPSEAKPSLWEPPSADGEEVDSEPAAQPLVPPPRHVPVGLRLVVFSGGTVGFIGWFFLGFGMVFVWVFGPRHLPLYAYAWAGSPASVEGVVLESRSANASENERPIYRLAYSFVAPDGTEHRGVSYATGYSVPAGSQVTVEYVPRRPEVSQIRGMRRNLIPEWVMLFVAIFPGIGLAFVVGTVKQGIKANRLLAHGQLASGVLAAKTPTNTSINNRTVYQLTFDFEAGDGRRYQAMARTHEPERLEDQRREPLLYDVFNPSYSVMLDSLPGSPTIDPFGHFEAPPLGRVIGSTLVPGLAIVGHGTYLLIRLFG